MMKKRSVFGKILVGLLIVALAAIPVVWFFGCAPTEDDTPVEPAQSAESDTDNEEGNADAPVPPSVEIEELLVFTELSNGTYAVSANKKAGSAELVIPGAYNGKAVTEIGAAAFENCQKLTAITIPASITSIDKTAFLGCSALNTITVEKGKDATYRSVDNCVVKDGVIVVGNANGVIPKDDSVIAIADYAFAGRDQITSVTIPASITSIGKTAFSGCSALNAITVEAGEDATYRSVDNCVVKDGVIVVGNANGVIPQDDSVTAIADYAFAGRNQITSVTIPANITAVKNDAFKDCTGLTSVSIPKTVAVLESRAFDGCSEIKTVEVTLEAFSAIANAAIPETVKILESDTVRIGMGFFRNMSKIKSITLPDSITVIDDFAFEGCTALTSFNVPANVNHIGVGVFSDCGSLKELTSSSAVYRAVNNCLVKGNAVVLGCANSTIPESGVTTVASYAFYKCPTMADVVIPSNINTIEDGAFWYCDGLKVLKLSEMKAGFSQNALTGCTKITTVQLPLSALDWIPNQAGVSVLSVVGNDTVIPKEAFKGFYALTDVTLPETVTDIGDYAFAGCGKLSSFTITPTLKKIGEGAFEGCVALTSLTIPNGIESIGQNAFEGCVGIKALSTPVKFLSEIPTSSLITVEITDGAALPAEAFLNASKLTKIALPDGMTAVGDRAFFGCVSLKEISIPASVTNLGANVFVGCGSIETAKVPTVAIGQLSAARTSLKTVEIVAGASIAENAFADFFALNSVTVTASVQEINAGAFRNCENLVAIQYADGSLLTTIGNYAFENCRSMTSLTLSKWVRTIGEGAFAGCTELTEIELPANLDSLSNTAFSGCKKIAKVTLPLRVLPNFDKEHLINVTLNSATDAEGRELSSDSLFRDCTNLVSVVLCGDMTTIGESAFQGCTALTSIVIPEGVTYVGKKAFYGCTALESVSLPASVSIMNESAFAECTALKSVSLPTDMKLTKITASAFEGCLELTEITLPVNVVTIGDSAFKGCAKLETVTFSQYTDKLEYSAFENCDALKDVYFNGSEKEWNDVTVSGKNDTIENAQIHFAVEENGAQ